MFFDNIKNSSIEEFKSDLESLKNENYNLWGNEDLSNEEIINLYKDLFVYFFFSTYDDYILRLRNSKQYIGSSFVMKYFKRINNEVYYKFNKDTYIIIDSGYTILEDINNYEIELKLNKDINYLWNLKPIIKDNHLFYFIQYIGSSEEQNRFISMNDIENIKINIYSKNLIDNNDILKKENS